MTPADAKILYRASIGRLVERFPWLDCALYLDAEGVLHLGFLSSDAAEPVLLSIEAIRDQAYLILGARELRVEVEKECVFEAATTDFFKQFESAREHRP